MSFYYGISSDSVSSFFNSSFSSSSKNSNTSALYDLYSSLGDYGTIRSGTYSKLLKSYYKKTGSTTSSESSDNKTPDKTTATEASALKSDADTLTSAKFTEENRSQLTKNITDFTESYNDLVKATSSSTNNAVSQKYKSLTNLTSKYSSVLSSVGVTVNSDKTLSVNSDTLAKANMSTLKSTFSGTYSYTSQVGNYASLIYSANSNGVDSIYTGNGTISTLSTSSILDTYA